MPDPVGVIMWLLVFIVACGAIIAATLTVAAVKGFREVRDKKDEDDPEAGIRFRL